MSLMSGPAGTALSQDADTFTGALLRPSTTPAVSTSRRRAPPTTRYVVSPAASCTSNALPAGTWRPVAGTPTTAVVAATAPEGRSAGTAEQILHGPASRRSLAGRESGAPTIPSGTPRGTEASERADTVEVALP